MDKNKVKAPILLQIALAFFTLLFFLSVFSLLYFRFYLGSGAVISPYIKLFFDIARGSMGYIYYTVIPAMIVLILIVWTVLAKAHRSEKVRNVLEHTVFDEDENTMRALPFQDIVSRGDSGFKNHHLRYEVSTQTVKSPIVPTKKAPLVHKADEVSAEVEADVSLQFAPSYVLQSEISSISELKEIIAKGKNPEVSICSNGDLSSLSDGNKEQIKKINSLDANKIFAQIKQNNITLDLNGQVEKHVPKHKFRVLFKQVKQQNQKPDFESENISVKPELVYLTADEIVSRYRIDCESKKNKNELVFSGLKNEEKTLDDMAKFYYESDLLEYSVEEEK